MLSRRESDPIIALKRTRKLAISIRWFSANLGQLLTPSFRRASWIGIRAPMGGRFDRSGVVVMVGSVSIGVAAWFLVRFVLTGFFTVDPNERAVKTILGRAQRLGTATTLDTALADLMRPDERERYVYPLVRVIGPGGPYFKWPWERV